MPRRKKDASGSTEIDISMSELTDQVFPEGIPKNPDGSVASEGAISPEQAKKIGAISPESAKINKSNQRKMAKRMSGQSHIPWGEHEALQLFDSVKLTFPNSYIFVTRNEPHPSIDFPPVPISMFRTSSEFYTHVERNFHKESPASSYSVKFKEAAQERARGVLRLPDTTHANHPKGFEMSGNPLNPFGFPNFPQGYPNPYQQQYPGYPPQMYPPGYPPPGYPGYPPPQAAPQTPVTPTPAPAPAPAPAPPQVEVTPPPPPRTYARQPENHFPDHQQQGYGPPPNWQTNPPSGPYSFPHQQQQPQPIPVPVPVAPGIDANLQQAMIHSYENIQRMQQMMYENQMQMSKTLGIVEEMKRQSQNPYFPPPPIAAPPQQQTPQQQVGVGGFPLPQMPPEMVAPQQQYQQPQQHQQYHSQPPQYLGAFGYPPPPGYPYYPPQPQAPQQQVNQNPLHEIEKATTMISGFSKAMRNIKSSLNGEAPEQQDDDDEDQFNQAQPNPIVPPPFHVMPLGIGPNAPVLAHNEDGKINVMGTLMGNAPRIMDLVSGITNMLAQAQQVNQMPPQQQQNHQQQQVPQLPPQQHQQRQVYQQQPQQVVQQQPQQQQIPQQQYQPPPQQVVPQQQFQQPVPEQPVQKKSLVPMSAFMPNS